MPLPTIPDGLHTSISQMKCFLRCPRQYELKYKLGIQPAFVPVPFAFGLGVPRRRGGALLGAQGHRQAPAPGDARGHVQGRLEPGVGRSAPAPGRRGRAGGHRRGHRQGRLDARRLPCPRREDHERPHGRGRGGALRGRAPRPRHRRECSTSSSSARWTSCSGTGTIASWSSTRPRPGSGATTSSRSTSSRPATSTPRSSSGWTTWRSGSRSSRRPGRRWCRWQTCERGPRDEDDFLRTAVGVLRAVDAGVAYPVRGWACKGCQFAHACKPKRPKLALVA